MIETRKNFSRMILGKILVEKIRRVFPSVRGEARPPAFGPLSKFGGGRLYLDSKLKVPFLSVQILQYTSLSKKKKLN